MDVKCKKGLSVRLRRVGGQVRGLERMIEHGAYCVDVIHQSLAIKEALSRVEDIILENHLLTHVVEQMKKGQKSKAAKEIVTLYKLSKRKK